MSGKRHLKTKSSANVLSEEIGARVDFWIHTFEAKRRRTEDKPEKFLQNLEGHVEPGTVCAIIGPQNSGKQKLLALLSGRVSKNICLGQVNVNNEERSSSLMRVSTSYLSNAGTTLVSEMTVEEAVDYTARLVLSKDINESDRKNRVYSVLKEVGLSNIIERKIGGSKDIPPITNEQRVRVSLAQVLMEGKKILFLDEPTKILDLLAAEKVLRTIVRLSEERLLTIFVSIEHPTKLLLELFHKCLFLAKGRQVYFGRVRHTVDFFSRLGHPIPEETSIYDHVLSLTVPDHQFNNKSNNNNNNNNNDDINNNNNNNNLSSLDAQEKHLDKLLERANMIFDEIQMSKLQSEKRKERVMNLEKYKRNNTYVSSSSSSSGAVNGGSGGNNGNNNSNSNDRLNTFAISWWQQVKVLFSRYWLSFRRNSGHFLSRLILSLIWSLIYFLCCENDALGRDYPFDLYNLITALTLSIAGIQALSLTGLPQAEKNARIYQSDMEQNLYRPSAFIVAHLFISLVSELLLLIPIILLTFITLGIYKEDFEEGFSGFHWTVIFFWFAIYLTFVAVICELLILSVALIIPKSKQAMFLITGFLNFFCVLFSGGVIRICDSNLSKGVVDIVATISWFSPTKLALDGLMLLTVKEIVYQNEPTNETGNDIMDKYYCFNTWLHADEILWVLFVMCIMLGTMLIVFFLAAKIRAAEAGTK